MTNKISLLNFFLNFIISDFSKYVPVGLFGFAKKTILVFLFTQFKIEVTEALKFSSLAYLTLAPNILL